jgi:hypothetical protein
MVPVGSQLVITTDTDTYQISMPGGGGGSGGPASAYAMTPAMATYCENLPDGPTYDYSKMTDCVNAWFKDNVPQCTNVNPVWFSATDLTYFNQTFGTKPSALKNFFAKNVLYPQNTTGSVPSTSSLYQCYGSSLNSGSISIPLYAAGAFYAMSTSPDVFTYNDNTYTPIQSYIASPNGAGILLLLPNGNLNLYYQTTAGITYNTYSTVITGPMTSYSSNTGSNTGFSPPYSLIYDKGNSVILVGKTANGLAPLPWKYYLRKLSDSTLLAQFPSSPSSILLSIGYIGTSTVPYPTLTIDGTIYRFSPT